MENFNQLRQKIEKYLVKKILNYMIPLLEDFYPVKLLHNYHNFSYFFQIPITFLLLLLLILIFNSVNIVYWQKKGKALKLD